MYNSDLNPYYIHNPVSKTRIKPILQNTTLNQSMQQWIHEPSNILTLLGDFNANYNTFPYQVDPSVEIVIKGQFPYARYLSYSVIGKDDLTITTIPDYKLIPDPGSTNPFVAGSNWNARNRDYTLRIRFTPPPDGINHFVPGAGNNIVYAATMPNGIPNTQGTIGLRIYAPSIGNDETGGVGMPKIMYHPTQVGSNNLEMISTSKYKNTDISLELRNHALHNNDYPQYYRNNIYGNCNLMWRTLSSSSALIQYDYNDAYIISNELIRDPNKLLYIRWKAPTYADTYHNIGIVGNEDMRYWSVSFVSPVGLLGLYTIADFQTIVDQNGYVNLVISFGAPRPNAVTTKNGFTWIDASNLPLVPIQLFYRNKVISENFQYSAKQIEPGAIVPPTIMGDYYPCGKYITIDYFS